MSAPLVSGSRLHSFVLDQKIALGGMAEIWSATEQLSSGGTKKVALKVMLREHTSHRHFQDMFWDEVNIARRLKHANIARVYDGQEADGHLYQVLELIDGIDVRRILRALSVSRAWFPVSLAVMVARDMARALNYAHLRKTPTGLPMNIVHRDISPHNVMVTRSGHAKVLDFGIATAEERLAKTRTGVIKGKVAYMAPEQAMSTTVDARTDIFATGVVLWEMLCMERLFRGATDTETVRQLMAGQVPDVQSKNSSVPDDVRDLVHHMLAAHPNQRPESMSVVENRLNRALAINYEPEEVMADTLAAWVAPFIGARTAEAKRKTAVLEPEAASDGTQTESGAPVSVLTDPSGPTEPEPERDHTTRIDLEPPDFE